jgi:hypothetical protein
MSRKSVSLSVLTSGAVLLLLFAIFGKLPLRAHAFGLSAGATGAALPAPDIKPGATIPPPVRTVPAESKMHTVAKGESVPGIVHHYLPLTTFLTGSELERAIRSANPAIKGLWPKPGSEIVIPSYRENWAEKPVLLPKSFEVRAVYLTGTMAGSAKGLEIIRTWRESGGNSVVFDIKDSDGSVSVPTGLLSSRQGTPRNCTHRNLPRRCAGNKASGTGGAVAQRRSMARKRKAGLDRLLQPQGLGIQHWLGEVCGGQWRRRDSV